MTLKVVGAGLGRTGTHSLKLALEQLLGGPCYHMIEVFEHPEHVDVWRRAAEGEAVDWSVFPEGYVASRRLAGRLVLAGDGRRQSRRDHPAVDADVSAEAWWKSANDTIFQVMERSDDRAARMARRWSRPCSPTASPRTSTTRRRRSTAYERHNADVRATADPKRLVDWTPGDGWEPICTALGVPVPDEPFPHVNTTEEFRAMAGLDGAT